MIHYIFKLFMIMLILLPFYLFFRKPWKKDVKREGALCLFMLFMLGLLSLALEGTYQAPSEMFRDAGRRLSTGYAINLIPFRTISSYFCHFVPDVFMVNIVGNIVMFIPWGFGLPFFRKKRQSVFSVVLFSALLPLFIETTQLFIGRSVDIDDLILNFTGGIAGGFCYFLLCRKTDKVSRLSR
jgi:glycopeptide antibiotics resistance protein